MLEIPADRPYCHLLLAQLIALIGAGLATVALGLFAFNLAGDNAGAVLGTALAITIVANVGIAPIAAAFAERLPRGIYERTSRGILIYLMTPRLRGLLALNLAVAAVSAMRPAAAMVYTWARVFYCADAFRQTDTALGLPSQRSEMFSDPPSIGYLAERRSISRFEPAAHDRGALTQFAPCRLEFPVKLSSMSEKGNSHADTRSPQFSCRNYEPCHHCRIATCRIFHGARDA